MKQFNLAMSLCVFSAATMAMSDDPLLVGVNVNQLEQRGSGEERTNVLKGQMWAGYDEQKAVLKIDADRGAGESAEWEAQLLFSQAVAPYWDLQLGVRNDHDATGDKQWLAFALKGLAPYWFEVDQSLFMGDGGALALRTDLEYELMLSQQWILTPELEFNVYAQNDEDGGIGAGLSDTSFGLRLRYEFKREFAPYVGWTYQKLWGNSADYADRQGVATSHNQWVLGVRFWW